MFIATAKLVSVSPYSQSRFHGESRLEKESPDDYEKRTWRLKAHASADGYVQIPPTAFKSALQEAAQYLGEKISGKGQATWTKHFKAGVMVMTPLVLPQKRDTVPGEWYHCHSDGKKGSGSRVMRCFPVIPEWSGKVEFHVIDRLITKDVFTHHLSEAGKFIGIGRFRPINGGFYGRFKVESVDWKEGR